MTDANVSSGDVLAADFKIGQVISRSLRIFLRNIVSFTALIYAASLPYAVYCMAILVGTVESTWANIVFNLLLLAFLLSLTAAIIVHKTFHQMRGGSARAAEAISPGIWSALAFVGVVALRALDKANDPPSTAVAVLVLMALWCVVMPVAVVEKLDAYESIKRGIALTKGYRWKILALLVLYRVVDVAVDRAVFAVAEASGSQGLQVLAETVWRGLIIGFGAVLLGVAYYSLRVAKEGVDVARIGTVFD